MITRNQFVREFLAVASYGVFGVFSQLLAFGPWLEKTPIGGVELSPGLDRPALESLLDRIEAETSGRPFIVTRTKWLVAMFDNLRLAVSREDPFVHWHPESGGMTFRSPNGTISSRRPRPRGTDRFGV